MSRAYDGINPGLYATRPELVSTMAVYLFLVNRVASSAHRVRVCDKLQRSHAER